ncbi:hypothetical protein GGR54DRAFT_615934 [Hypoxylon sp. NC1633]|nr:hypothetical protein GGR54DRAFT_615934 [Hypoxylon sp. NC1633]
MQVYKACLTHRIHPITTPTYRTHLFPSLAAMQPPNAPKDHYDLESYTKDTWNPGPNPLYPAQLIELLDLHSSADYYTVLNSVEVKLAFEEFIDNHLAYRPPIEKAHILYIWNLVAMGKLSHNDIYQHTIETPRTGPWAGALFVSKVKMYFESAECQLVGWAAQPPWAERVQTATESEIRRSLLTDLERYDIVVEVLLRLQRNYRFSVLAIFSERLGNDERDLVV